MSTNESFPQPTAVLGGSHRERSTWQKVIAGVVAILTPLALAACGKAEATPETQTTASSSASPSSEAVTPQPPTSTTNPTSRPAATQVAKPSSSAPGSTAKETSSSPAAGSTAAESTPSLESLDPDLQARLKLLAPEKVAPLTKGAIQELFTITPDLYDIDPSLMGKKINYNYAAGFMTAKAFGLGQSRGLSMSYESTGSPDEADPKNLYGPYVMNVANTQMLPAFLGIVNGTEKDSIQGLVEKSAINFLRRWDMYAPVMPEDYRFEVKPVFKPDRLQAFTLVFSENQDPYPIIKKTAGTFKPRVENNTDPLNPSIITGFRRDIAYTPEPSGETYYWKRWEIGILP